MELYIDVLFLVSSGCHFLLLWTTGKLAGVSFRLWRICVGAVVVSAVYCLLLVMGYGFSGDWWLALGLAILGIEIAFFPRSWKKLCSLLIATAIASFLLAGFLEACIAMTSVQRLIGRGLSISLHWLPWQKLLWGCVVFGLCMRAISQWLERHGIKRNQYCQVQLEYEGRSCVLCGFWDTGNGLCTSEGKPVAVAECAACLSLFPPESILSFCQEGNLQQTQPTQQAQQIQHTWLTEIPFSALGTTEGKLLMFWVDCMEITTQKQTKRYEHMPIGLYRDTFAGGYEILMPTALLEEEGT